MDVTRGYPERHSTLVLVLQKEEGARGKGANGVSSPSFAENFDNSVS